MRRAAVIVLDACGVGALPDADAYEGDAGSNTLGHLAERVGGLDLPALQRLGLGSILPLRGVPPAERAGAARPPGAAGPGQGVDDGALGADGGGARRRRCRPIPRGFPPEVIEALEDATGRRFCCNRPFSGTEVLDAFGAHHLETGELILYTSADSVLQIAAHVDVLDEPGLYARLRGGARGDGRRAPGGARDRAAVRGRAGRVRAARGAARLRGAAARALLPRGAAGRGRAGARRGQDPRPVRRRGDRRQARGEQQREGDRSHDRAAAASSTAG